MGIVLPIIPFLWCAKLDEKKENMLMLCVPFLSLRLLPTEQLDLLTVFLIRFNVDRFSFGEFPEEEERDRKKCDCSSSWWKFNRASIRCPVSYVNTVQSLPTTRTSLSSRFSLDNTFQPNSFYFTITDLQLKKRKRKQGLFFWGGWRKQGGL